MKKLILVLLALLFLCFESCSKIYEPEKEYELIWEDNFDRQVLPNNRYWDYEEGYIRNNEAQYYLRAHVNNVRLQNRSDTDGNYLIIEARKEDYKGFNYTSGSIRTKREWLYGKFEFRAKLPTGTGTWPAIWLYGPGEIDIMENVGYDPQRVHSYVHTKCSRVGNSFKLPEPWNDFHIYSIEWLPDRIHFYIDDYNHFSVYKKDFKHWPFNEPHYLIINLAIGGSWGGRYGIDDTIFPQQFIIDYVKIYKINIISS